MLLRLAESDKGLFAGENEEVRKAVGRQPIVGRGTRILCMDGGGMKV